MFPSLRPHPTRHVATASFILCTALLLVVMAIAEGPSFAASPLQEGRTLFTNSVGPLPSAVLPTVQQLGAQNLAEKLEFEVPLRMRDYPKLLERIGRGEKVPHAELARDFLPLEKDYERVRRWLISEGFTITSTDPNRLGIFASGTLAQIQQSLQVEMVKVTVKGREFRAARTHPSLPASVASPILGINGLQPFLHARKHLVNPSPAINDKPPFLVKEVMGAYDASGLSVTGAGEKIAILIDSSPRTSDLTNFWSSNNIAQSLSNFETVNVNGSGVPATDTDGEATLDVEWSSSVAPGAVVRLYATGDLSFTSIDKALQRIISDLPNQPHLHQVSISLGLGETYLTGSSEMQTESQYFATLASNNVSVFVASGDAGSNPDDTGHNSASSPGPLQVEYESSDPSVTGVGGTNLTLDSSGKVTSETGWSGSGGGVSTFFSKPSWQTGTGVPSGTKRFVPDVSLVASDTTYAFFYFQGKQGGVAGTSWSAPTWAGFCALINQARANNSLSPIGLLNPQIYPLIGTSNFRDITSGSNGQYSAGVGYDRVTGIGVPDVTVLMSTLAGAGSVAPSINSFSPSSGSPGSTVIITGLNLSRATDVKFNGTSVSSFTANSSTQITTIVPASATSGPISVITPNGTTASTNSFTVLPSVAANDNFASATLINGVSGNTSISNVGATKESGEPNHAGNPGGASVWYAWTAPQSGIFTFDTFGSSFDTLLAVYTGSSLGALSPVVSDDDAGTGVTSAVSFNAVAGTIYEIAVDGHNGQTGTIDLNWVLTTSAPTINNFVPASGAPDTIVAINGANFTGTTAVQFAGINASFTVVSATQLTATVPTGATTGVVTVVTGVGTISSTTVFTVISPPANDAFASATVLSGTTGTITGTNAGATKEAGEPDHAGNPGGHSVWYAWTAQASNNVTFNTLGSSFDTILAAYTGSSVNALAPVASNDDSGDAFTSSLSFAATQGTTYYIAIDGAGGVAGNLALNWAANVAAPAVDGVAPLSGGVGSSVTISGSSLSSVTEVDFNGVSASFIINSDTQITAKVPDGATTGQISVTNISGIGTSVGSFSVSAGPPNDSFANAAAFSGTGAVIGTNVGATKEAGEPNHAGNAGGASVWWNWTAPSNADYAVSTQGSGFDTLLAVYTGPSVSSLAAVASNDDDPQGGKTSYLVMHAVAGTVYRIAVDGLNGASGQIALSIVAANSGVIFSTGFEASEGYSTTSFLSGQKGWVSSGAGSNGVVTTALPGLGQQAYIGSHGPRNAGTYVWEPINYTPQAGDKITFQVTMKIVDSTNGSYDQFYWAVFDKAGKNLFGVVFDNDLLEVGYFLDDSNPIQDTGFGFDNATVYTLQIVMDFANNSWNASVNGNTLVSGQPMTTAGAPLDLGDVDAVWATNTFRAGNNSMVFDNYSITRTGDVAPQILLNPQAQTVSAGSNVTLSVVASGSRPMTYQWRKDLHNIDGATNANLPLQNIQPGDAASYDVVVQNDAGSATSNGAQLQVTLPQAPNLTPYQPGGWSDRVVVTNAANSTTDDPEIFSTDSLYVDWAIINSGLQDASAGFVTSLYVDNVLKNSWQQSGDLPPNTFSSITAFPIGLLSSGAHQVKLVVDSANQVTEFDESDNTYTKTINVRNPSGFYSVSVQGAPATGGSTSGGGTFQNSATATVTATPASGYRFVEWTDEKGLASKSASYSFKVTADRNLIANFVAKEAASAPVITITVPTAAANYSTIRSSVALQGTASDNFGITAVTWENSRGGSGKASGTTSWVAPSVPLQPGDNLLTATVHDSHGQVSSATVLVSSVAATNFTGNYANLLSTPGANPTYLGLTQLSITNGGSFTGALWFEGKRYTLLGRFSPEGLYSVTLGKAPHSLFVHLMLSPGSTPDLSGTVTDDTTTAVLFAERVAFSAKVNPWTLPGRYTVSLTPDPLDSNAPQGSGFSTVNINTGGVVTYAGHLSEGTAFGGSSRLSPSGIWPFYTSLYRSTGYAAGPVAIQSGASPLMTGVVDWRKAVHAPGGHYAAAIQTRLSAAGEFYNRAQSPIMQSGARQATLGDGDLQAPFTDMLAFSPLTHFTVNDPNTGKITLSLDPATGLLNGKLIHPTTGRSIAIHAIYLQPEDTAAGYFLGPTTPGSFIFSKATSGP